jgi:NAD(P)-dependent dehydrogenase (short-subunit alcohol dehydrogenase family)
MDLTEATVLLTGATSGIGRATALALAPRVGRLMVHGPGPPEAVAAALGEVRERLRAGAEVDLLTADYGRLDDVVRLADQVRARTGRLDILINNAGRAGPARRTMTDDGNEVTLQTNYLAPIALTTLLLDLMAQQDRARIVNVASATHLSATLDLGDLDLRHGYSPVTAYAQSKLAVVTATCWLADHPPHPGIEAVSLHPGIIATDLLHAMFSIGGDRPEQAARNIVAVAARTGDSGTYYDEARPAAPNPLARDRRIQERLHDLTATRLERFTATRRD